MSCEGEGSREGERERKRERERERERVFFLFFAAAALSKGLTLHQCGLVLCPVQEPATAVVTVALSTFSLLAHTTMMLAFHVSQASAVYKQHDLMQCLLSSSEVCSTPIIYYDYGINCPLYRWCCEAGIFIINFRHRDR